MAMDASYRKEEGRLGANGKLENSYLGSETSRSEVAVGHSFHFKLKTQILSYLYFDRIMK